jgi:TetR/AcrR family transcriptional regulator, transcriptional repressor for nem operon
MRKSKAEKADTHSKIVSVAAKRFREHGLEGVGIDELMKEIGATAGGFYKHFGSRDDLVIEALSEAFRDLDKLEQRSEDLPALLRAFVSEDHCAHPENGCALTAVAGDVRHASTGVKAVFTERVKHGFGYYADRLNDGDAQSRRARAILIFCAALGGITLARAVSDKSLSREIIATLREELITLSKPSVRRGSAVARRPVRRQAQPASK